METKPKGPECLPSSVVFRFLHVKILWVHRSLVRSLESFQSRGKVDFPGSSRPTLCQCFLNPSSHVVGMLGLLHWPRVQIRGACNVSAVQTPVRLKAF